MPHLIPSASVRHLVATVLFTALCAIPAIAQSLYQGTYTGYAYIRIEGAVTQPETPTGIAIAVIDAAGNVSVQDGEATGTIDSAGTITWTQPNNLFLSAGNVSAGVLHATGSTTNGATTTHTRLELGTGGGFDAAESLDDYFSLVNPLNHVGGSIRVIHDGTRFVALGENGSVSFSADGLTWETKAVPSGHPLTDIAYGNGTYVAVGEGNTVLTSTDLETWVPRASGIGGLQNWSVTTVTYFSGRFYIGNLTGDFTRSVDSTAAAWEAPFSNSVVGLGQPIMRVLNGRLYLTGKRTFAQGYEIHYSTDGTTFTKGSFSPSTGFFSVLQMAYANGKYVLNLGAQLATSTDGLAFTRANGPANFSYLGYDGERFIARSGGSTSTAFYHSPDASTWTTGIVDSLGATTDAAAHNGVRIAVGREARRSTDGLAWAGTATSPIAPALIGSDSYNLRATFGNGLHILHGKSENHITRDGLTWTAAPAKGGIVFANGIFLSGNEISTDGVNWVLADMGLAPAETVARTASSGAKLLAITSTGRALTSTDGFTWLHANPGSPAPTTGLSLVGANGQWFSLNAGSTFSRSLDDGVTWTNEALGNATLNAIAYGNGRWILTAQNDRFYVSTNGINFSQAHPNITGNSGSFTSVNFIDGLFFVYGGGQGTYYVGDGLSTSWEVKNFAYADRLSSASVGPDFVLLTGSNHLVLRAERNSVGHPVVTAQPPAELTLTQEGTLQLQATAIGNGPLTYRWFRNGLPLANGPRVSGADTASLEIANLRPSDAGPYTLVVSNALGHAVTETTQLTLNLKSAILSAPQSLTLAPGADATFSVTASADTTGYQWLFNGSPIPGKTSATLTIPDITAANAGLYQAALTNANGTINTAPASLSIRAFAQGLQYDPAFTANLPTFTFADAISSGRIVRKIIPLPDGKAIIVGLFRYHNGTRTTNSIARINADGTLDTTYQVPSLEYNTGQFRQGDVIDAAVDSTGRLIAVFETPVNFVNQVANFTSPFARAVLRFNADGTLDRDFIPATNSSGTIRSIAIDSQDRILLGGTNVFSSGTSNHRDIARFTSTGTHDDSFNGRDSLIALADLPARSIHFTPGGEILAFGTGTSSQRRVLRITSSGTVSPGFAPPNFGAITPTSLSQAADGSFYVTGPFTTFGGQPRQGIVKFSADGTLDTVFAPSGVFTSTPTSRHTLPLPAPSLLVGGFFTVAGTSPAQTQFADLGPNGAHLSHPGTSAITSSQGFAASVESFAATADFSSIYVGHGIYTNGALNHGLFSRLSVSSGPLPGAPALAILGISPGTYAEPGDTVTFAVAAVGADLTYQWFKGSTPLEDENSASLTLSPVAASDAGSYSVRVTDASGFLNSTAVTLTMPGAAPAGPSFSGWGDQFGLTPSQSGFDHDPAGDGVDNAFKYLFDLPPLVPTVLQVEVSHPSGNKTATAATILGTDSGAPVETGKTYRLVSYRLPADMKGLTHGVEASPTIPFTTGAQAHPLGDPVPDGDFLIHSYYITPATQDALRAFWRLALTE